jgi:hypothetical protein
MIMSVLTRISGTVDVRPAFRPIDARLTSHEHLHRRDQVHELGLDARRPLLSALSERVFVGPFRPANCSRLTARSWLRGSRRTSCLERLAMTKTRAASLRETDPDLGWRWHSR